MKTYETSTSEIIRLIRDSRKAAQEHAAERANEVDGVLERSDKVQEKLRRAVDRFTATAGS